MSIVKLQAHTERGTCARDLRFVAKASITPDEDTILLKDQRFNKQATHQGLEKVLSKVKPYVFLKQTLQRNLSLRI